MYRSHVDEALDVDHIMVIVPSWRRLRHAESTSRSVGRFAGSRETIRSNIGAMNPIFLRNWAAFASISQGSNAPSIIAAFTCTIHFDSADVSVKSPWQLPIFIGRGTARRPEVRCGSWFQVTSCVTVLAEIPWMSENLCNSVPRYPTTINARPGSFGYWTDLNQLASVPVRKLTNVKLTRQALMSSSIIIFQEVLNVIKWLNAVFKRAVGQEATTQVSRVSMCLDWMALFNPCPENKQPSAAVTISWLLTFRCLTVQLSCVSSPQNCGTQVWALFHATRNRTQHLRVKLINELANGKKKTERKWHIRWHSWRASAHMYSFCNTPAVVLF